jgi:Dolichyl-phosphate-mannose-protein mannosyltransferase
MPDELIYSSLANSVASTGHLAIRGVSTTAYSLVYPLVLALPFSRADPVSAYATAKWVNALLMSLGAVPVFLLARRVLPRTLALATAVLSLLLPSLVYTSLLMTENAFFPVFLLALLAIVRSLERPSTGRQVTALAAIALAYLTRAEGVVLLPVFGVAALLLAFGEADWRRELRRYRPALATLLGALAIVLLGETLRGGSPSALLGTYAATVRRYPLEQIPRWIAANLADLELYLGFLAFVPAAIVVARLLGRRTTGRPARALAATSAAATVCVILLVAVFSAGPGEQASRTASYPKLGRVLHERYLFYLAPLFLIFFIYWLQRRREFSNGLLLAVLVPAVLLPLTLPYQHVLTNADFEALALLPWNNTLIAPRNVPIALTVTAAILLPTLLLRRNSILVGQAAFVAAVFFVVGLVAAHEVTRASTQLPTSHQTAPAWVDAAIPAGANVAVVWKRDPRWPERIALGREHSLWRAEFFNRSVKRYYYLGTPMHYDLPETQAKLGHGRVSFPGGAAFRYVLAASDLAVHGRVVARDERAHLVLYKLDRPKG